MIHQVSDIAASTHFPYDCFWYLAKDHRALTLGDFSLPVFA
jgi:hypothetical protein